MIKAVCTTDLSALASFAVTLNQERSAANQFKNNCFVLTQGKCVMHLYVLSLTTRENLRCDIC